MTFATGAAYMIYGRAHKIDRRFHLIFGSILIAAACVTLSRYLHLQPGYLYGLIAGFGLAEATDTEATDSQNNTNGRLSLFTALIVLGVSLASWFVRPDFMPLHGARPGPLALIAVAALTGLAVAGVEALAFGLLPLPFLPGARIWKWNKLVWSCVYVIALGLLVKVLLLPNRGFVYAFRERGVPRSDSAHVRIVYDGISILSCLLVVAKASTKRYLTRFVADNDARDRCALASSPPRQPAGPEIGECS